MSRTRLAGSRLGGLHRLRWALLVLWAGEAIAFGLLARMCLNAIPPRGLVGSVYPFLICTAGLGLSVLLGWVTRGWWSWAAQSCSAVLPSPQRYGMPRVVVRRSGASSETAVVTGSWNIGSIVFLSLAQGRGKRRGLLVLPFQARSHRVLRAARLALAVAREVQPLQDHRERYC
uniref:Transmembrane protein n=1 Tax=Cupriavidus pinatubonensis (strain JMP 134 / LMG 1197) TaxID=264198 RepID=Q46Z10_CUPPJ